MNVRLRPSVWLEEEGEQPLLIDCGPDWRRQMERLGVRQVKQGLLTHAHYDHIGGLVEWADACRWLDLTAELRAPAEVIPEVLARYPWVGRRLKLSACDEGLRYGGWQVWPWRVNHGKNGYAYAYRFEKQDGSGKAWAYCPDSFDLSEAEKRPLQGLTLLVLGTSFYDEPYPRETRSLYDVREGLQLVEEAGAKAAVFTHQSHDIDLRRDYGLPSSVRFAREGMTVEV
ncbi:MBL fold metallo-hydrolase [Cohnella lubricantis]|nr:phosphoribosyl 1,2-cyclic phosphate phosphodiesterase [Cohnella lubricantis]